MKIKSLAAVASLAIALPFQALASGAIAVDEEYGAVFGTASGQSTQWDAGRSALAKCVDTGSQNCKVAVRYEQCGAYVTSWRFSSVGTGATKAEAIKAAKKGCSECKVVIAECEGTPSNLIATSVAR